MSPKGEWVKASSSERQLHDVAGVLRLHRAHLDLAHVERWVTDVSLQEQWAGVRSFARP